MTEPDFKLERVREICTLVSEGETVREIAKHFGVSAGTIIGWVTETEAFTEHYRRAREAASDLFEGDIIDAAMNAKQETAAADRVKIDALKWIAARRAPKRYGDRIEQVHSGGVNVTEVPLTDAQRAALDRVMDEDV